MYNTYMQIKAVDMPDNLQNAAIEIARASVEEHSLEVGHLHTYPVVPANVLLSRTLPCTRSTEGHCTVH